MAAGIVEGSMVDSPQAGAPVSAAPFRNAALAKGDLGAAVGQDVGGLFDSVAQQITKARNTKAIFQADQHLTQTKQAFIASLSTNPELAADPQKWLPAFKEQAQQATDAITNQDHIGPELKDHLSMMTQNWTTEATGDIQTAALKRETKDTRDAGLQTAKMAELDGNAPKAITAYKALNEAGVIGPQMTQALIAAVPGKVAEGNANIAIATKPIDAPKLLPTLTDWAKVKPENQRILLHQANEARAGAQAANLNNFSQQLDDSPDHTIPDGLKKAMNADQITAKGYEGIVTRQKRLVAEDQKQASLEDRNEGLLVGLDIANATFVASTDPKQQDAAFTDRINGVADKALRLRLTDQLQRKRDAAQKDGKSLEKPVFTQQMAFMKSDFEAGTAFVPMTEGVPAKTGTFRGWFDEDAQPPQHVPGGMAAIEGKGPNALSDDDIKAKFGKDATREGLIEAVRLNYAQKVQAFTDWAHDPKNENATPEQAQEERNRLERPDAILATKATLTPKTAAGDEYKSQDDVISAYKAGKMTRAEAKKMLQEQFGAD